MLSDAVAVDRSKIAVGRGLHTALGLAIPLAFAAATGYVVEGVAIAAGAMLVGFADRGGTYGTRARLMLTTSALVGASTAIGMATGSNDAVAVLLMAIWGFGAGFAAVGGPGATIVGLNTALALLIASDFPADLPEALRRAAFALAGGLLQTLLALVVWPVLRRAPEREAVAGACGALAKVADSWPDPRPAAGFAEAASAAEDMLADHGLWASERDESSAALRGLAEELELLHAELFALRAERERLVTDAAAIEAIDAAVQRVATVLRTLDADLRRGRVVPLEPGGRDEWPPVVAGRLDAIDARLRELVRLAGMLARASRGGVDPRAYPAVASRMAAAALVRANLTLRSTAFRHGVRLAAALAVAVVVYRLTRLGHGYWVPLTVVFVLKPDYGSTFLRGLQRYAGTIVGVSLATLIAVLLSPGHWGSTVLVFVFGWATYALFYANYALFTASITGFIVFFSTFGGAPTYSVVVERTIDTAIGGAIALTAFLLWPTWEGTRRVGANVAAVVDAQRRFLATVLAPVVRPDGFDPDELVKARTAYRVARSNAHASLERALGDPPRGRGDVDTPAGVLVASRALTGAILEVDARLRDEPARPAVPQLAPLAAGLDDALRDVAGAERDGRPARPDTGLHDEQAALAASGAPWWIAEAAGRMVDSVETMLRLEAGPSTDVDRRRA